MYEIVKNRLNSNLTEVTVEHGGHTKFYNFHHSFEDLVPKSKCFDAHPEYFSEIGGKHKGGTQLCLTNPEVLEIATKEVLRWIEQNPLCKVFRLR